MLPKMKHIYSPQSSTQDGFGGINQRQGAGDGEIYSTHNMCLDNYPLLSTRNTRSVENTTGGNNGIFALDGLLEIIKTDVLYKGNIVAPDAVTNSRKVMAALGSKILILPDKKYYDTKTNEFFSVESKIENQNVKIKDGTYAGEEAKANTIYAEGVTWSNYFKVGDAVTISGCILHTQNNMTAVVREIEGNELRFLEHTFTVTQATEETEGGDNENITVARTMPDMDFICESNNRMWGCKGDTVYCSKLGDLTNWNVYDGLASDSYTVDVGSPGDFTGCITYLGYPTFFKEDVIYKAYGTQPSDFRLIRSASLGVSSGNHNSLAIAGETLFYMSRTGVVAYSGSTPYDIFLPFGGAKFSDCVAGSDGKKYYISMKGENGAYTLAVYDTSFNAWYIEDDAHAVGFAWNEVLCMMTNDKIVYFDGESNETFSSAVEFNDFTMSAPNKKTITKIALRLTLEESTRISVKIKYDSRNEWEVVKEFSAEHNSKKSFYLPVIPHRCDHFRIRIEGASGQWTLNSLTREYSYNSMN